MSEQIRNVNEGNPAVWNTVFDWFRSSFLESISAKSSKLVTTCSIFEAIRELLPLNISQNVANPAESKYP